MAFLLLCETLAIRGLRMKHYLLKRLLLLPISFLSLMLILFFLTRILPGGPLERALARETLNAPPQNPLNLEALADEQLQTLKAHYGLDQNFFHAYTQWILRFLQGDLGQSLRFQEPVLQLISERLPISLLFGISSLLLAYGLCVPLAHLLVYKAGHPLLAPVYAGLWIASAIPSFVYAGLFFLVLAAGLGWFPLGGLQTDEHLPLISRTADFFHHAALPLAAYLLGQAGALTLLLKNQLEEAYSSECVRLARAKGASRWQALRRDAWPLSRSSLIASFPQQLGSVLAGSLFIERIFNIDGMGLMAYESLIERDYPVVLGFIALLSLLHLCGQLLADLCLAWLDPRIRFGE